MKPLDRLLAELERIGVEAREIGKPKIREMRDYELLHEGRRAALLRVFAGRPPYYRAWLELYAVDWSLPRELLRQLVEALADALTEPGERLFIDYSGLDELDRELQTGTKTEETWLGRILAAKGLAVRDMYYPEGFMEGGPKLIAEKKATED